jgi:hypothetical protein
MIVVLPTSRKTFSVWCRYYLNWAKTVVKLFVCGGDGDFVCLLYDHPRMPKYRRYRNVMHHRQYPLDVFCRALAELHKGFLRTKQLET